MVKDVFVGGDCASSIQGYLETPRYPCSVLVL